MSLSKNIKNIVKVSIGMKNINKYTKDKKEKKIFYMLVPNHGNMGDQAIAYATKRFYEEKFSDYKIIEIERDMIQYEYKAVKNAINDDDIIVLHGGGNMGNLYIDEEDARRFIIDKFRNNIIISMTQTISFTNDEVGKKEKEKTIKIYNNAKRLTLLAREDKSYKEMKNIFTSQVIKVPDIVFSLGDKLTNDKNRDRITTCLRDDKESVWKEKKEDFLEKLNYHYKNVFKYDTGVEKMVNISNREEELNIMWDNFKRSKVVVTDRLHGMIFCIITKTPCIALKSLDHKVVESYNWVKDLDYVKLVDDLNFDKIKPLIDELKNKSVIEKLGFEEKYFNKLASDLRKIINQNY